MPRADTYTKGQVMVVHFRINGFDTVIAPLPQLAMYMGALAPHHNPDFSVVEIYKPSRVAMDSAPGRLQSLSVNQYKA